MTLETFSEKFVIFADALDAVTKMRELVLELAIRGKIVAQEPADEPAAVLLKKIQVEKSRRKATADSLDKEAVAEVNGANFQFHLTGNGSVR